jgi:hypothetical protein
MALRCGWCSSLIVSAIIHDGCVAGMLDTGKAGLLHDNSCTCKPAFTTCHRHDLPPYMGTTSLHESTSLHKSTSLHEVTTSLHMMTSN